MAVSFCIVCAGVFKPTVSLFTGPQQKEPAQVTLNFGPAWAFPPPAFDGLPPPSPMCAIVGPKPEQAQTSESAQVSGSAPIPDGALVTEGAQVPEGAQPGAKADGGEGDAPVALAEAAPGQGAAVAGAGVDTVEPLEEVMAS